MNSASARLALGNSVWEMSAEGSYMVGRKLPSAQSLVFNNNFLQESESKMVKLKKLKKSNDHLQFFH